jgi:hypothetical protein
MDNGTCTIGGPPFTVELLKEAMAKMAAIPKNDQWLVVTPEGDIYKGTIIQVLPVLIQRHPLCKPFELPIKLNEPA